MTELLGVQSSQVQSIMLFKIASLDREGKHGAIPMFVYGEQPNYTHEIQRFKCKMRVLCCLCFFHPFGNSVVAKLVHTATMFIVCHLHVCNLSPVPSKQCNADMMPGLSRIMCQCYGGIVPVQSTDLSLIWHLSFWSLSGACTCLFSLFRLSLLFCSFLSVRAVSLSLSSSCVLYSAVSALNAKLN